MFLRQRLVELRGLGWIACSISLAIALVSYHASDPSLNHATAGLARNLLGRPGAYVADLFLQSLGFASVILVAAPAVWGGREILHRTPMPLWLRLTLLPIGIMLLAISLAALPKPPIWPLASGLGGFVGLLLLGRLTALVGLAHLSFGDAVMATTSLLLALALLVPLFSLRLDDVVRFGTLLGRAFIWMGRASAHLIGKGAFSFAAARTAILETVGRLLRRSRASTEARPDLGAADDDDEDDEAQSEPADGPFIAPRAKRKAVRRRSPRQAPLPFGRDDRELPSLDLLQAPNDNRRSKSVDQDSLTQNARLLESVLDDFGVRGEIQKIWPGPVVTLYELEPAPGTKSSRVISLADDIARSMSAVSARVAVVPGRNVIGIELPNVERERVYLAELISVDGFDRSGGLPLALGKDIGGTPVVVDLARMPHLLIAGTTGSGKSVALNTMILSLLYRLTPEQCRLILIDPKMLELSVYDGIPHLLTPVVTDARKAVVALKWTVREMEDRYRAMSQLGVRNIASYNARLSDARRRGEVLLRKVQTGFDSETGKPVFEDQALDLRPLPFIVVVVDEMADLMLVAGKDIEAAVQRLSQMARAAGIHLIMATQRPSVDVITGTIKANFPTRISFQVTSKIDSRTILGEQGAEQLLGQGDMLYMVGGGRISRVHGPFVSDEEVESVVRFLKNQGEPEYLEGVTDDSSAANEDSPETEAEDELYDQAVALVLRERKASTSFVQRHLQIGYNRAARLIERMESEGLISAANHVGKREILAGEARGAMR
jgi:S-DNA-T family DNA segregation ATPase FtsK/SpoIIIE